MPAAGKAMYNFLAPHAGKPTLILDLYLIKYTRRRRSYVQFFSAAGKPTLILDLYLRKYARRRRSNRVFFAPHAIHRRFLIFITENMHAAGEAIDNCSTAGKQSLSLI